MNVMFGAVHKAARETIRKVRALSNGAVERKARELAPLVDPARITVDERDGYSKVSAGDLGLEYAISKLSSLCETWKRDPARGGGRPGHKDFMRYLLRSEDLFAVPEIMEIVFNKDLFGAVTKYLRQVPWLVTLKVWQTIPNETAVRSQLYHYDHRDTRQAKIFFNLNNVDENTGPLHFLPASSSLKVDRKIGYTQEDYTDEQVYSCCSKDEVLKTVGPPGSGYIVDTARCLHYGSRGNKLERLVLMICFARANCVDSGSGCDVLDPVRQRLIAECYSNDKARSFSLKAS
jgi:hypothetical protein